MLYSILKRIVRMSLNLYFRKIDVIGTENIPENGPVIFVSNHPSALIDPLLVATNLKRKIHFLAAAEFFGKGMKERILKSKLNMIPVHRPWIKNEKDGSNAEMFEECYKSLNEDKSIILFPEASSATVSKIRELKTGAVRIKAGFEAFSEYKKTVPIIPIGLSYSNPHEFQSQVIVKIGEPILFDDTTYSDQIERFRSQTSQVQEELKKTIIHIDNSQNEDLVKNINRLFVGTFRKENQLSIGDRKSHFEFYQNVAKAVAHFEATNPSAYAEMSLRIENYFNGMNELGISDDILEGNKRSKPSFLKWIFIVLGALIAIPSLVIFFVPYQLTKIIFKKQVKAAIVKDAEGDKFHYAFTGTLIFVVGMLLFGLWTPVVGLVVYVMSSSWLAALIAMILLYPMMRFSMIYAKVALRMRTYFKGKRIWKVKKERMDFYASERAGIVEKLKNYQISWLEGEGV